MIAEWIVFVLELAGTAAFAVSGGLTAIEKKLDFLGITVLSATTASGGGVIRDLLLGNTPPAVFQSPVYVLISAGVSCVLMLMVLRHGNFMRDEKYAHLKNVMGLVNLFDAAGLGVFTIVGMNAAISGGYGDNGFLTVFVGVITGVGGGMLRDVLVRNTPTVLKKEIYAMAAVVGAVIYYVMRLYTDDSFAMIVGMLLIVGIRTAAICLNWNLPAAARDADRRRAACDGAKHGNVM